MRELKTIPQKIINYLKERDFLYIVLFDVRLHESPDVSARIMDGWHADIAKTFAPDRHRIQIITV